MGESEFAEPVVDRWAETSGIVFRKPSGMQIETPLSNLGGGIMTNSRRTTANRIEGLLSKMLEHPPVLKYSQDVEENLAFLYASLQLDMITMFAESCYETEG